MRNTLLVGLLALASVAFSSPMAKRDQAAMQPRQISADIRAGYSAIISSFNYSSGLNLTNTTYSVYQYDLTTIFIPNVRASFLNDTQQLDEKYSSIRVGLLQLVEYNDTINITASQNTYTLINNHWPNGWENFTEEDTTVNTTKILKFETQNSDNSNASIVIDVYVTSNFTENFTVDNSTLYPNAIKFVVTISGWQYMYNNSRLALIQAISSMGHGSNSSSADGLTWGNNGVGSPIYSWNNTWADGNWTDVSLENYTIYGNASSSWTDNSGYDTDANSSETMDVLVFKFDKALQPKKLIFISEVGFNDGISGDNLIAVATGLATGLKATYSALVIVLMAAILLL